jgi:hypothetical protein
MSRHVGVAWTCRALPSNGTTVTTDHTKQLNKCHIQQRHRIRSRCPLDPSPPVITAATTQGSESLTRADVLFGTHSARSLRKTCWSNTATTATVPETVRENKEVVPVNVSTWVLPSGIMVGR